MEVFPRTKSEAAIRRDRVSREVMVGTLEHDGLIQETSDSRFQPQIGLSQSTVVGGCGFDDIESVCRIECM